MKHLYYALKAARRLNRRVVWIPQLSFYGYESATRPGHYYTVSNVLAWLDRLPTPEHLDFTASDDRRNRNPVDIVNLAKLLYGDH